MEGKFQVILDQCYCNVNYEVGLFYLVIIVLKMVRPELQEVIESCLQVLPQDRPTAEQLLSFRLFNTICLPGVFKFPVEAISPDLLRIHQLMSQRPLTEICHLWHLVGGDVEAELRKAGILRNKPSIFSLPW